MGDEFEVVPASEVALELQAEAFNAAFTGYIVCLPVMNAASMAQLVDSAAIDPGESPLMLDKQKGIVGFAYVNLTNNVARVAAMGTVPSARRHGIAGRLLTRVVDEARKRGNRLITLEVFEQNTPAVTLYRANQFDFVCRLFGWQLSPDATTTPNEPGPAEEVSLSRIAELPPAFTYPDIPWQISEHAVTRFRGARAFKSGDAIVVVAEPGTDPLRLLGLFWRDANDWESPRKALSAVIARFPDRPLIVRQVFPESYEEIFAPLGFTRDPVNQLLLRKEL